MHAEQGEEEEGQLETMIEHGTGASDGLLLVGEARRKPARDWEAYGGIGKHQEGIRRHLKAREGIKRHRKASEGITRHQEGIRRHQQAIDGSRWQSSENRRGGVSLAA